MWRERFDDKFRAEGVAFRDYNLLFMDRGVVIFASRDARVPSFSEIVESWSRRGMVYSPNPSIGGWGKFIRTELKRHNNSFTEMHKTAKPNRKNKKQQLRKGGKGWLHVE
jgi:hypothetical protein